MNTTKNLFILYYAGTGGNHLANIIALSDQYYRDVDYSKYNYSGRQNISGYEKKFPERFFITAHFHIPNSTANKKTNIFPDHVFGYINNFMSKEYSDKHFIVIQMPNCQKNSLAFNRLCRFNQWHNDHTFPGAAYSDLDCLYKQQTLKPIMPLANWDTIDSELLFSPNIDQLIQDIETKLDIKILDKDLARSIHQKWIEQLMLEQSNCSE